jgi:hypothetical protein
MLLVQLGINSTRDVWKFSKLDEPPGPILIQHMYYYVYVMQSILSHGQQAWNKE